MTDFIEQKSKGRNMMVAGIVAVTLALVVVMKFFMSDNTAAVPERPVERQQLFKESAPPSGLNPVSRSESGSGGGLDMFSETNAGFYGEEKATATAAERTEPAVVKSTKPAAVKSASVKAKPKSAVIPRLKPASFGGISPTDVAPGGAGQGMPDISGMMKQIQQQGGNKDPSGN